MDTLYRSYQDCLSLWLLKVYRDLHKNKTFGSLKLLLKLRNIKFLRHFSYVILNSRGDLDDPLIEFLLYLVVLVTPPSEDNINVNIPISSSLDSPASACLSLTQSARNTPRSNGKTPTKTHESNGNDTQQTASTQNIKSSSNPDIRWGGTVGKRNNMGSLSIDSVADNSPACVSPVTPNEAVASPSNFSATRSPSRPTSTFSNSGFRAGRSLRDSTRKLSGRTTSKGVYTAVSGGVNTSRSPLPDSHLIPGYVVFINMFLSALVPILLYTYLQRVKGNGNKHLAIVHDYYKFANTIHSKGFGFKIKTAGLVNSIFSGMTNFNMGSTTSTDPKNDKVFKSFRTFSERLLLKVGSFNHILGLIGNENFLHELREYKSLFGHFCKQDTNTGSAGTLDNTTGLQLLLYKLSLLNLNYHDHNYTEVPNTIYNIYNKLDDSVIKAQLESSLIYCYRLRINDLNLKVNVGKLFKNLIKFSKYSETKLKRYYNPLVRVPVTNYIRSAAGSSHLGKPSFNSSGSKGSSDLPNLMYGDSSFMEFSDIGTLNLIMNNLVFFGNNLVYLNRVLTTSHVSATCASGANLAVGDGIGTSRVKGYVNDEDRYMKYVYRIVRLIKGDNYFSIRVVKNGNFRASVSGGLRINNMEYVYNMLLHLVRYVFQLNGNNSDVLTYHPRRLLSAINNGNTDDTHSMDGPNPGGVNNVIANKITIDNKYSVFNCKNSGSRVFVNEGLCLLVFKLNFDFYHLVFGNFSAINEVHKAILASNLTKMGGDSDCSNLTRYSCSDSTDKTKAFVDNNKELVKNYLYKVYTYLNLVNTFKEVKKRISYEMCPVPYWLVCSHLKLLESRLDSQCQSKPP